MEKMEELERERDEYFEEKDYFDRMDELERQRDEYFEEKDRRERAKYFDRRAKIKKKRGIPSSAFGSMLFILFMCCCVTCGIFWSGL